MLNFRYRAGWAIVSLSAVVFMFLFEFSAVAQPSCPTLASLFSATDLHQALVSTSSVGDGTPLGVNRFMSWRTRGRIGAGNNAQQYSAFVPWGQVFPQDGVGTIAPATFEMRDFRAYILSRKTQRWRLVTQTDHIQGRQFLPNFDLNKSTAAKVVMLPYSTSVVLNPALPFHFWPSEGRVKIDGGDVGGVLVMFMSRMSGDAVTQGHYVISAGADYWKSKSSVWQNYKTNGDAGIGRFTILSKAWGRSFMFTGIEEDLSKCVN